MIQTRTHSTVYATFSLIMRQLIKCVENISDIITYFIRNKNIMHDPKN